MRDYRDLRVWQAAFAAAMDLFVLAGRFPARERFTLTDQLIRSSRSVCANISEAWRKRRYPAAFVAKLNDAEAEAAETRCHLDFARACGYVTPAVAEELDARYSAILGQLVRMISRPRQWTIHRTADTGRARPRRKQRFPPSPTSPGRAREEAGDRSREAPGQPPPVGRKKSGDPNAPRGQPGR